VYVRFASSIPMVAKFVTLMDGDICDDWSFILQSRRSPTTMCTKLFKRKLLVTSPKLEPYVFTLLFE
jgi:hypothetical protein